MEMVHFDASVHCFFISKYRIVTQHEPQKSIVGAFLYLVDVAKYETRCFCSA